MSQNSEPMIQKRKPRAIGKPHRGDRYSHFDKKMRQHKVLTMHLDGISHAEIQQFLEEEYNLSDRTARMDIKAVEAILEERMAVDEDRRILEAIRHQRLLLENLENRMLSCKSDRDYASLERAHLERQKYFYESFYLIDHFKNLKSKDTMNVEVYRELIFENDADYEKQQEMYDNGEFEQPEE